MLRGFIPAGIMQKGASGAVLTDVFISHAGEDKESFVRPLAERLRDEHIEVWFDDYSLKVGDSLRRSIDRGLAQARFGIVVLSPSFFNKQWPEWELDGLVARQNAGDSNVILPVWHDVDRNAVLSYSPSLADKLAVDSRLGIDEVARRLLAVIRPQGSTLIIARDHLIGQGFSPPVISDDWWLDVAAAAESNEMEGGFQEPMGWGRWGFPLPEMDRDPAIRGLRMACAALQMTWQDEAETRPITQLTSPEKVHAFINSQPGLRSACRENIRYLISYAPQLAIRGFGGEFEDEIEVRYVESAERGQRRRVSGDRSGTALTTDGRPPGCDDEYALRDPEFGRYGPAHLACGFVQGNYVANGPPVKYYSNIDYAAWLLSEESLWLPEAIRDVLTRGMAEWGTWFWDSGDRRVIEEFGFEDAPFTGEFAEYIRDLKTGAKIRLKSKAKKDLIHRLAFSIRLLGLPEEVELLTERVTGHEFLGAYLARPRRKR